MIVKASAKELSTVIPHFSRDELRNVARINKVPIHRMKDVLVQRLIDSNAMVSVKLVK
jgi:hypothetical protein